MQRGNISQLIAERLVAEGRAARVRTHGYGAVRDALQDLGTGGRGASMKLAPVFAELEADGTLQRIRRQWLGNPFTDQHLGVR